jgi:hypothetical protein
MSSLPILLGSSGWGFPLGYVVLIGGYILLNSLPLWLLVAGVFAALRYAAARQRDGKRVRQQVQEMEGLIDELYPSRDARKEPAVTSLAHGELHLPPVPAALEACLLRLPTLETEAGGRLVEPSDLKMLDGRLVIFTSGDGRRQLGVRPVAHRDPLVERRVDRAWEPTSTRLSAFLFAHVIRSRSVEAPCLPLRTLPKAELDRRLRSSWKEVPSEPGASVRLYRKNRAVAQIIDLGMHEVAVLLGARSIDELGEGRRDLVGD